MLLPHKVERGRQAETAMAAAMAAVAALPRNVAGPLAGRGSSREPVGGVSSGQSQPQPQKELVAGPGHESQLQLEPTSSAIAAVGAAAAALAAAAPADQSAATAAAAATTAAASVAAVAMSAVTAIRPSSPRPPSAPTIPQPPPPPSPAAVPVATVPTNAPMQAAADARAKALTAMKARLLKNSF